MRSLKLSKPSKRKRFILGAYVDDMRSALTEVARVLTVGGAAVYVIGENTVEVKYIKTATVLTILAETAGLKVKSAKRRSLPPYKRYMPPPTGGKLTMDTRMRSEVVLHFPKL